MNIIYTKHAKAKFEILERHGFTVTEAQVADALLNPNRVITEEGEKRVIAQKRISDTHLLRVIYRQEGEDLVVITFYPGRRARYENPL
jgi:uncharacterized DUF497 family protein